MTALHQLMTADEVAALLRVPRSTVSGWARIGTLPSIKLGRHRRFVRADVMDAIEQLRVRTGGGTSQDRTGPPVQVVPGAPAAHR